MIKSNSEGGHARNVANFEDLLAGIAALGAAYNPARAGLKLAAMQTQLAAAKASLAAITSALPTYTMAVDARELAFASVDKLGTRIVNLYKVSLSNKAEADTAISLLKKIRGSQAAAKATAAGAAAEGEAPKRKYSTSQRSYDMRIEHFEQLIKVVSAHPAYAPNEAELKAAALNTLLADLRSKSAAVTVSEIALDNVRQNRDKLLYAAGVGVVDVATDARNYVKALFGNTSSQVKQLSAFKFRKQVA